MFIIIEREGCQNKQANGGSTRWTGQGPPSFRTTLAIEKAEWKPFHNLCSAQELDSVKIKEWPILISTRSSFSLSQSEKD